MTTEIQVKQPRRATTSAVRDFFVHVLGQVRIYKNAYAGIMHGLIFWGMLTLLLGHVVSLLQMELFIPFVALPFPREGLYLAFELLGDLAGLAVLMGVAMALFRRIVLKPTHLDSVSEDYLVLGLLALVPIAGYINESLRLIATQPAWSHWSPIGNITAGLLSAFGMNAAIAASWHDGFYWVHLSIGLLFTASIPFSKLRHILFTPTHILTRSRRKEGVLSPIEDIENTEFLGVGQITEFTSRQLLSFDACVQCGRCEDICPVENCDGSYSPKEFIQTLFKTMNHEMLSPNGHEKNGNIFENETVWGCTTCGVCLTRCPAMINPIDEIIDIRRYQVLTTGQIPKTVGDSLRNMERQGNPWGIPAQERMKWTEGLDIPLIHPDTPVDVLLFLGCSLSFDTRNQKIARSMVQLLQAYDVDFALLGPDEMCCGETARRLGHEYLFQMMTAENIELFSELKFSRIATSCPHCLNTIMNEYPQFGGDYEVIHITELLQEIGAFEELSLQDRGKITYHDPCYLGRYNQVYDAPREILQQGGANIVEMNLNRDDSFCCGGGGGQMWMESEVRINNQRLDQAMEMQADLVATACPYCLTMFEDAISAQDVSEKIQAMDICEVLAVELELTKNPGMD